MDSYVNESVHPMCFKTDEAGTPRCLSTHCVLRNDPVIPQWSKQADSPERDNQRMLLINSMYDPFELSRIVEEPGEDATAGDYLKIIQSIDFAGGQRQQRIVETASYLNGYPRPTNARPR